MTDRVKGTAECRVANSILEQIENGLMPLELSEEANFAFELESILYPENSKEVVMNFRVYNPDSGARWGDLTLRVTQQRRTQ